MPDLTVLMVTKNEAHRYLEWSLGHAVRVADRVFVYDDQSTDDTPAIAARLGATVAVRPDTVSSFADHEGRFRQAAWDAMALQLELTPGSLVFVVDADQIIAAGARDDIDRLSQDDEAWVIPIVEVFDWDFDGAPLVRVDGEWGRITGCALARWRPRLRFADVPLACGSVPISYRHRVWVDAPSLLHLGYVDHADRVEKHARYVGRRGHNPNHIASILTTPKLVRFNPEALHVPH